MKIQSLIIALAVTATSVASLADSTCFNYRFRYNKDGVKSCAPTSENLAVLCVDEENAVKQKNSPYTAGSFKITITAPNGNLIDVHAFSVRSDVTQNNETTRDYRPTVDSFKFPDLTPGLYYQFVTAPGTPDSGFLKMYDHEFCFDKI